jgi:hypothetical protein
MSEKIRWMPNCRDVSRMVSESMDARPPFSRRMAMWIHLMMCRYCCRFRRQILFLRKMSRIDAEDVADTLVEQDAALSPTARERLKKIVEEGCGKASGMGE